MQKKLALVVFAILISGTLIDYSFAAIVEVKRTSSDIAASDQFSQSISISGDTMVVGAPENDDAGTNSGSAYIFQKDQGGADNWGQVKKLTASDAATSDFFGTSVSIWGDTVLVGASGDDDTASNSGSVYIFERNEGGANNWGQVKKLTASDAAADDQFGNSISISADTAVIGAFGDDDNGAESGSAYVFDRDEGGSNNWGEVQKLLAGDGAASDFFGISVSVSGDSSLIGAFADDTFTGSAYVFDRDNGGADNWGQVKKLTASDAAVNDEFGISVSISDNSAAIGAHLNDDDGTNSGSAYVFDRDNGGADNWGQVKKLTASDAAADDQFGFAASLLGDTLAIGAFGNDGFEGSAYVFKRNDGGANNWGQTQLYTASDAAVLDDFGRSISTTATTTAVGAPENEDSGFAYLFFEGNSQGGPAVGGSLIPIDTVSLLLAVSYANALWLIPVVAAVGIGFVISRKSKNS